MRRVSKVEFSKLKEIAELFFAELKSKNPEWDSSKVFKELNIPQTDTFVELISKTGFRSDTHPTPEQICTVAGCCMRGLWSEETIAHESGIPLSIVKNVFEVCSRGYGLAPYGKVPYGGSKKFSTGKISVPRRVTTAGQLSYRGCLYTLGAHYRGRNALVQERGSQLLVMFQDRAPLYLTRRQPRSHRPSSH